MRSGGPVVEITVVRSWVETYRVSGERSEVGDTDVYRLPLATAGSSRLAAAPAAEIAAEGEQAETRAQVEEFGVRAPGAAGAGVGPVERRTDRPDEKAPEESGIATANLRVASSSFDHEVFAEYGKKWTKSPYRGDAKADFNPDYPYFDNNCANFVSQMYNKAGWKRTGGANPHLDGNWDDDLTGLAGPSWTCSQAKSL